MSSKLRTITRFMFTFTLLGLVFPAFAEEDRDLEEVVVTGSYIKGSPEDAASPIQVISREDIDIQSAVTIDDITKNLTINSGTTTNFNYDTENATLAGKANVNLRGLGLNSTLVLFNGKRQVVAAAESQDGSEFVDINTIPLVMLERVEILKDGGSALYGSDAIAGVVNFILRDDFEGIQVSGNFTRNDRSDSDDRTLSAIWGTSFNDDRTHLVISGEYFDRDPYGFLDTGLVDAPDRVTVTNSQLSVIIPGFFPGFSDLNPAYVNTEISAITGQTAFTDPLCKQQGYYTGLFSDPVDSPDRHCREDQRAFRAVQIEQERTSFMLSLKHEFSEAAELYGMVQYYDQDLTRPSSGAFGAIDSFQTILPVGDPVFGLGSRAPGVVAARDAAFFGALSGGADPITALGIAGFTAQAVMPSPANAPITAANGGPNTFTSMGYSLSKRGDFALNGDSNKSESNTEGAQIGLRGDFTAMNRAMSYDVSVSYSSSETYREELTVNRNRLELAQNGLGGPNCVPNGVDSYDLNADADDLIGSALTGSGVFGGIVSYVTSNPAPGYVLNMKRNISLALTSTNQGVGDCQFINPFLTKETTMPNDPALLSHIYQVVPLEDRKNTLTTFDAVLTSELFEMGGGTAHGAIGYQRRDSSNKGNSYPEVNPGLQDYLTYGADPTFLYVSDDHFYGAFTKDFSDDREVDAIFAEMQLPITETLEVQLAVRYEDYGGDIGDATTPKIGARWQPVDSWTFRASYGQAFRAPNTGVLFKGVGFDGAIVVDPLAKDEVKAGLLPATPENSETVVFIQNGAASPLVGSEEADTYNVGVIFTPDQLGGLLVSLDYYKVDFTDKVVNQPPSVTLANELENFNSAAADPNNYVNRNTLLPCVQGSSVDCVVNPSSYLTSGVQRSPQGALQVVDFFNVNAGSIDTSGIDITMNYTIDAEYGTWNLGLQWNHIIEFVPKDIPGFENGILGTGRTDAAGSTGDGSIARSMPDNKANFTVNFRRSNHSVTGIVRYIAAYDNIAAEVFNSGSNPPKTVFSENIDSFTTFDFQYNYLWDWGKSGPLSITVGAINAFDEDPPARDDYNQGFDSTTVDPRGRRYYFSLMQSF
jgi:iron complex outermembrane receptor protein